MEKFIKNFIKNFELQIDEKPNGMVIRLNDEKGCILRICGIPKKLVYQGDEIREFIDIVYNPTTYERAELALGVEKVFKENQELSKGRGKKVKLKKEKDGTI